MAINDDIPGLQVTVLVDGNAAPEFVDLAVETRDGCSATTRYIESRGDATFTVQVVCDDDYGWGYKDHAINAVLFVDGGYVDNCIIGQTGPSAVFQGPTRYDASRREWSVRGMKFSTVRTVEEPEADFTSLSQVHELFTRMNTKNGRASLAELGSIRIEIYRGAVTDRRVARRVASLATGAMLSSYSSLLHSDDSTSSAVTSAAAPSGLEICEKSLKGRSVTHGSTFSAPQRIPGPTDVGFEALEEDQGPIATFRFLYKSEATLIREGIKPSYAQALSANARAVAGKTKTNTKANKMSNNERGPSARVDPLAAPARAAALSARKNRRQRQRQL
ncbi:hypothetical protein Micbo1qcDRAFT_210709 [Microdochium bolleyi]|uniref:DUF7918 domain-containing protein n=1 Tax=Microdochium bolleyi TaxID=196109 RepID=A0A136JH11_9PEZI|nr:hypothetical protein Micbo1qcDRAFT_210709 [Microdochium bolleyi]